MKDNLRQFVFGLAVLVLAAGLEELLPKFLGVGFPFLLTSVQTLVVVLGNLPMVCIMAVVAGALQESLSSLPPLASVSYFLLVVLFVRTVGFPRISVMLAYPCHQLWLTLWTGGTDVGIFSRLLLSLPVGGLTACLAGSVIVWAGGKGAVGERD